MYLSFLVVADFVGGDIQRANEQMFEEVCYFSLSLSLSLSFSLSLVCICYNCSSVLFLEQNLFLAKALILSSDTNKLFRKRIYFIRTPAAPRKLTTPARKTKLMAAKLTSNLHRGTKCENRLKEVQFQCFLTSSCSAVFCFQDKVEFSGAKL